MSPDEPDIRFDHFSRLELFNFRGFGRRTEIPLAPLTFLVGPNSGGKSTISDALLLLGQSHLEPFSVAAQRPHWGGPLVDLGSYTDAVYEHNPRKRIDIAVEVVSDEFASSSTIRPANCRATLIYTFRAKSGDSIGRLAQFTVQDYISGEKLVVDRGAKRFGFNLLGQTRSVSYAEVQKKYGSGALFGWFGTRLGADIIGDLQRSVAQNARGGRAACERIKTALLLAQSPLMNHMERVSSGRAAPRRWYPVSDIASREQYTFAGGRVFSEVDPGMVGEPERASLVFDPYYSPRRARRRRSLPDFTLESALQALGIADRIETSQLSAYHRKIDVRDSRTGVVSNLIDVGYGASQVLPVLRACLSQAAGPLFIEQPEVHLHPRAQGILADLLIETSRVRPVVVETHSVHLLNRARIQLSADRLDPRDVSVIFVGKDEHGSVVFPIRLDNDGDFIDPWPKDYGFFEERYRDTMQLLKNKTAGEGG